MLLIFIRLIYVNAVLINFSALCQYTSNLPFVTKVIPTYFFVIEFERRQL